MCCHQSVRTPVRSLVAAGTSVTVSMMTTQAMSRQMTQYQVDEATEQVSHLNTTGFRLPTLRTFEFIVLIIFMIYNDLSF